MKRLGHAGPYLTHERRDRTDRRNRLWWSIWYGSFNPRRRNPSRRLDDSRFHSLDWYSSHLLAAAIGILLLSVVDAFMTLTLLEGGADEVNPIMGVFVYRNVAMFAALKMGMTSVSIVMMVVLARYRFMRVLRVAWVLYGILVAYATLIVYEILLLNGPGALHIL
jgi:hypothetical protein